MRLAIALCELPGLRVDAFVDQHFPSRGLRSSRARCEGFSRLPKPLDGFGGAQFRFVGCASVHRSIIPVGGSDRWDCALVHRAVSPHRRSPRSCSDVRLGGLGRGPPPVEVRFLQADFRPASAGTSARWAFFGQVDRYPSDRSRQNTWSCSKRTGVARDAGGLGKQNALCFTRVGIYASKKPLRRSREQPFRLDIHN